MKARILLLRPTPTIKATANIPLDLRKTSHPLKSPLSAQAVQYRKQLLLKIHQKLVPDGGWSGSRGIPSEPVPVVTDLDNLSNPKRHVFYARYYMRRDQANTPRDRKEPRFMGFLLKVLHAGLTTHRAAQEGAFLLPGDWLPFPLPFSLLISNRVMSNASCNRISLRSKNDKVLDQIFVQNSPKRGVLSTETRRNSMTSFAKYSSPK